MHLAKLILISGGVTAIGASASALRPVITPTPLVMTVADHTEPRPWLGIRVRETPAALAAQLGINQVDTVVIDTVADDSPAAKAELERYDLVLGVGDDRTPLAEALRDAAPGDRITLHVLRAGEKRIVKVTLGKRPGGDGAAPEAPARVDLEDTVERGTVWSYGIGAGNDDAQRAAQEAMRQAQRALRQAQKSLQGQNWGGVTVDLGDLDLGELDLSDLNFDELRFEDFDFESIDLDELNFGEFNFGEIDFEGAFDHEAFAAQMQAFAERHAAQMADLEAMISQQLEPAMEALEVYIEKLMAVIDDEASSALGEPLADRLAAALDDADIDATARQIESAVRTFISNAGFNVEDADMRLSHSAQRIERLLASALEDAGVRVDGLDEALEDVAAWLDDWSATMTEEGAAAIERLEAEFKSYQQQLEGFAPELRFPDAAPEPAPRPTAPAAPLAQPASGKKA